ncbi:MULTISPECIES: dTDP-4-dehydrorhamnose reductase [unclassified Rathayibacter]|uniref:dTDP-4-dehydrorhamnose reductase n=1 Tax=unclassified Rathayibacter TaxID=2609250 RepID=UPI00188B2DE2|nr:MULTISPECIES: dTDP-4-dehydrorhamnose reductase [unclassified Rathayibacter]MBF4461881.1 dTDP-4-dehydrorhamnose reductase [Rathayibacter sp. VKM Ac-2879]MBF4503294.1 dTDP-4-dehydrorhamnose reductase [Rathayibacter sp. VKM Ac-2878]
MTFLITGASGMLGTDLRSALGDRPVTALGRGDLDVTDLDAVRAAVAGHDAVINCAAYTRVDDAESDEEQARLVNAVGAGNLARATSEIGAALVQVSTDYVFDGSATSPYAEGHPREPISAYGRTKAEGEELVLSLNPERGYIVRTAWLYGAHGGNFAKTMVRLAASHDTLSVVDDQRGQPTWTGDLAARLVDLVDADAPAGVYHGTNAGETTWFGFARAVFDKVGLDPDRIRPTDSGAFVRPAPRPAYSVLGHDGWSRAGLAPLRSWQEALDAAPLATVTP